MSQNLKRAASPEEILSGKQKRQAIFDTSLQPPRNSIPSNPENSMDTFTPNSPVHFNNSHLHEDELLLYSLMTLVFPLSTFIKAFEPSKYEVITNIIHQITGIQ